MGVHRLGYVHARVTDMEDAKNHYSNTLGMKIVHEEASHDSERVLLHGESASMEPVKRCYLKCWDEWDHHSLVLEETGVGLVKLGYKVSNVDDLDKYENKAKAFGVQVSRMSKGDNLATGDGVRMTMPSGHVLELYHEMEYTGTDTGTINPDPWPRDMRGVGVHWIDHCLVTAEDPGLFERFMMEALDFRPTERAITDPNNPELIASWLTCEMGQTPHDLAVAKGPDAKLHHFAFFLETWNDLLRAGDIFSQDDVPIDVGPTRHGITRGQTIYFFDSSGNRNEVFAGGYRTMPDFPTITWTGEQLAKGIFYISREMNEKFLNVVT
jgi:catechol 2,3-dioxygenase